MPYIYTGPYPFNGAPRKYNNASQYFTGSYRSYDPTVGQRWHRASTVATRPASPTLVSKCDTEEFDNSTQLSHATTTEPTQSDDECIGEVKQTSENPPIGRKFYPVSQPDGSAYDEASFLQSRSFSFGSIGPSVAPPFNTSNRFAPLSYDTPNSYNMNPYQVQLPFDRRNRTMNVQAIRPYSWSKSHPTETFSKSPTACISRPSVHQVAQDYDEKLPPARRITSFTKSGLFSKSKDDRLFIDDINENDVVAFKGNQSVNEKCTGNAYFRELVHQHTDYFNSTVSRKRKTHACRVIVEKIAERGGRFVKKDKNSPRYYCLTEQEALTKASKAMNDAGKIAAYRHARQAKRAEVFGIQPSFFNSEV